MFPKTVNGPAIASLLAQRAIYAVNWFSVAALFTFMASDLDQGISGLGIVTSSFFLGISIAQVPGGLSAAKYGPKRTVVFGMLLSSASALAIALVSDFELVVLLRFVIGVGMALVFSPSIPLVAKYYRKGSEGLGIGLYSGVFNVGAAAGLFGLVILGSVIGWRPSMVAVGLLGLASTVSLQIFLPRDESTAGFRVNFSKVSAVFMNRELLLLGLPLIGFSNGSVLFGNFIVYYLHEQLALPLEVAGIVGGVSMVWSLVAAPFAGRLYDRTRSFKKTMLIAGAAMSVGLALTPEPVWGYWLSSILVGFGFGAGFALGFIVVRERNAHRSEYETLAIGWVNALSLVPGFVSPLIFTFFVVADGYSVAWYVGALITLVMVIPVVWLKQEGVPPVTPSTPQK